MKNQYFGDANDYRKYGLLRCIAEATGLPIGILWMLTDDDGRSDGEFRRYLSAPRQWRHHDEHLYKALAQLLEEGVARDVDHAERWGLVPGATYCLGVFTDESDWRTKSFAAAMANLGSCPLLFLDPDDGVEVRSVPYGRRGSSKYVYWREMEMLFERGHSLLVYQHYGRVERSAFEAALAGDFRSRLGTVEVADFSTAHVAFFLVLQEEHAGHLPGIRSMVEARWKGQIVSTGDDRIQ